MRTMCTWYSLCFRRGAGLSLTLLLLTNLTRLAQAQGSVTTQTQSFSYTGQVVTWMVPTGVTSLTIEAQGAEGGLQGNQTVAPGKGAVIKAQINVTPGQSLSVLVGQTINGRGAGGGGSFVVAPPSSTTAPTPLVIAGGGGGASGPSRLGNTIPESPTKHGQAGQNGGAGGNGGGAGGTNGSGGRTADNSIGSGGGGLLGNGQGIDGFYPNAGGRAFVNGGGGGQGQVAGGFGGGGAGGSQWGGGGGGYSGGGGGGSGNDTGPGGGGGSYYTGTSLSIVSGDLGNSGNGLVTISYAPVCSPFTVNLRDDGPLTCVKKSVLLTTSGGPTGANYTYSPGAQASRASSATATVTSSGPYSVTVTVPGGCSATATTIVSSNTVAPSVSINPISQTICQGQMANFVASGADSYSWSSGSGQPGQTTASISVSVAGPYTVTGTRTSNGCSATATANLAVTPLPDAPSLVTAASQPYPAGVTSLTISQNVGDVTLVASGCSGGQLLPFPTADNTYKLATTSTGTQTFTVTCTQNGCTGPAASFRLTVVPTTLSVLHRDADYGNTGNNIIKPFLQLANSGAGAIPYSEVTVRYWLTSEGQAPPTNFAVYYAPLGAVNLKYVPLSQPRQGALGYVEYSFPGGGSLSGNGNSGPIENGIQKPDGSNFNESDDYSYQANYQDYNPNSRITAYRNGVIYWGQEPTAVSSVTAVQVYTQAKDGLTTSQIQTRVELRNTGNVPLAVQDFRLRYYFSSDNNQTASVFVDYADIGANNIQARVIKLPAPVGMADSYVELRTVPTSLSLSPMSSLGAIDFRLVRSDNGLFDQSNDYSYAANYGTVGLNNRVTVLLNNRLIFGTPPSGAPARVAASEPVAGLRVKVLGNPVVGADAQVELSGAEGQAVNLRLVDLQGRLVHEQRIETAAGSESVRVPLGQSRGTLLLKVSTASQQQSLKLVRP